MPTIVVSDTTHELLLIKQLELKKKMRIQDLADLIITRYIDLITDEKIKLVPKEDIKTIRGNIDKPEGN